MHNNIFVEDIPSVNESGEKLVVCHGNSCNRNCIEPTHLCLKTLVENLYDDKIRDNTIRRGENGTNSKITEEQAILIKNSKDSGKTQKERSIEANVSINIVQSIDNNCSWTHIPDKNGDLFDNSEKRQKSRERYKKKKEYIFTEDDHKEAIKRIKDRIEISENIHPKVETSCHLFTGYTDKGGYGTIKFKGVQYQVHVLSYYSSKNIQVDKTNKSELLVCHKCDTPRCCNPEHLQLGTIQQNALDSLNYSKAVKLTENDVREIKTYLKNNSLTIDELSKKYNISKTAVKNMKDGKRWNHVIIS